MNEFYTYVYLDTRKSGFYSYSGLNNERFVFNYEPFYIGKGKGTNGNQNTIFTSNM